MKRCSSCKVVKTFGDFHKNKSAKDGLNNACKICKYFLYKKQCALTLELAKNNGKKLCCKCNKVLDLFNFYKQPTYCKFCIKKWKENAALKKTAICNICNKEKYVNEFVRGKNFPYETGSCKICKQNSLKKNNPKYIKEKRRLFEAKHRQNIEYRLHSNISRMLRFGFKNKKPESTKKLLPYTIKQLKQHLEMQFESWMNWNNHGKYYKKIWNDNDNKTWTWQIDHIIPQSELLYNSIEHPNFKKCWALENIRPLNAKINVIEGTRRIRHIKKRGIYDATKNSRTLP